MTNGAPKPPPGFVLVDRPEPPEPPPGFRRMTSPYVPIPGVQGQEALREQPGIATNLRRSVTEGATLGFSDEITALVASLVKEGLSYDQALQVARERMARIPTAQRVGGNIVGGVATAPMMGFRAPAGAAQAFRQGTGLGALAGAGYAEGDLAERVRGAAVGGALGGPLAVAGQQAIGLIGRAIARARQGVDRQTAKAMDRVLQELQAGEVTPQQAAQRVQRLGPEGMFADVPELQRLAQQTAARTTTGQRIAQRTLEGRTAGGGARINAVLDNAFQGRPLREVRQGIVRTRAQEAKPLYEQALEVGPLRRTEALEDLIGEKGSSLIKGQIASIKRSNPRFRDLPDEDPNLLHAVRVALSERSKGLGANKRNINDVVQQLTDAMDDAGATGYRQAVDTYRSDSLMLEAFDLGRKALTDLPENVAGYLKGASTGEREAFISGLGREVARRVETGETGNAAQAVRGILRGEKAQVLRETFGPEAYGAIRNRLLRELSFSQTAGRVLGGSPTQQRQAQAAEQMRRLGRVERAGEAIRGGRGMMGAVAEGLSAAQPTAPNVAQERALAQLLFRSQGQGLGQQRFAGRTPLLELAQREALLRGTRVPAVRGAVPGAAATGAGQGGNALLNLVGF